MDFQLCQYLWYRNIWITVPKNDSGNRYSNTSSILIGVPWGSVCPFLFILYAGHIQFVSKCKIQAYAYDAQIYLHFRHGDCLTSSLLVDQELGRIRVLSEQYNLKLNPLKTHNKLCALAVKPLGNFWVTICLWLLLSFRMLITLIIWVLF